MRFFFDRNTCRRTARMLHIYGSDDGHEVRHHDDDLRFHPKSKDTEIIRTLHREDPGWVFLSGDGMILRNRVERATLAECNLTYVLLHPSWGNRKIEDTCWMMVKLWPNLLAEVGRLKVRSLLDLKYASSLRIDNRGATAGLRP